jgi:hypothetical protein
MDDQQDMKMEYVRMWRGRERACVRETRQEEWYQAQGQQHRAGVGGRGLQEQCVEVVKRDVTRHLALLPDLPAEVRERLLAAFIQGRLLDARLLQLCIQNGWPASSTSCSIRSAASSQLLLPSPLSQDCTVWT